MPKKTEPTPQRPGEAAERRCRLCGLTKPIAEFHPRWTVPVSRRVTNRGPTHPGGNIGARMPECIACSKPYGAQKARLWRFRAMTLPQLKASLDRLTQTLEAVKTVFLEKTQGRTA